jgi:hypothetical protein
MLIFYYADFEGHLLTLCCPHVASQSLVSCLIFCEVAMHGAGEIFGDPVPCKVASVSLLLPGTTVYPNPHIAIEITYSRVAAPVGVFSPEIILGSVRQQREERATHRYKKVEATRLWCFYSLCHFILSRNSLCIASILLPVFPMQIASI